jgi:hypothetical protein
MLHAHTFIETPVAIPAHIYSFPILWIVTVKLQTSLIHSSASMNHHRESARNFSTLSHNVLMTHTWLLSAILITGPLKSISMDYI